MGTFVEVVRDSNGQIMVVMDFGGFLGFGTRPIAVPVDAMVLLGQDMEVVAFTPEQLRQFPDILALRHHRGCTRRYDHQGGSGQALALTSVAGRG